MSRFWNLIFPPASVAVAPARLAIMFICLAIAVTASPVWADTASNRLRIAYTEFPPIEYQNDQGEPAGYFIELTRKVVEEAGYEADFIYLPVSRIYLYLKRGLVDLWPGLSNIPGVQGEVLESWVNVYPVQLNAWYLEGSEPLTHFDQLEGKTLIVIGGYTYGGLISWLERSERIQLSEAPNNRAALEMLKLKRGDYVLDYREPVQEILTHPEDSMIRGVELRSRYAAWLYSLVSPRAAVLRDELDDAYLRLVSRGEAPSYQDFYSDYVIPGFPEL
ncbi:MULTISPECIES: ABC transporter substrate-binding protein [unclassified Marinobacter]|uniref:substrate-binding periplasmic protein n=1 Tax=unclassified Marinobacter TaxID=83889 RepID=UPI0026E2519A|nr:MULTISPECIES: transporter substrate-binding domain-containing protein [unclassified Marinobacter]MDO6441716.1 transporter substrate-binding domain-containing protein [Marinobacter sp. 2_MG-2023]MDO6824910.1 transporter substrate-binding domain-containing protein [Marinobacter sp. 1_MG-2023]